MESLSLINCVEKLVVVNHSAPEQLTGLQARFPVQVIHQPNRGYGAGLNRGLQEVRDPNGLVLLCNPDIAILNHEAIEDLWSYMNANQSVGLVIPALVDAQMSPIFSCRKFYCLMSLLLVSNSWFRKLMPRICRDHYTVPGVERRPLEVDWGSGAAVFVRGSAGNEGPLFDERFFLYFEDVELCARMWSENRQVVYFPDLVCQHFESRLSHRDVRYFVIHVASLLKFIIKYKELPQRAALRRLGRAAATRTEAPPDLQSRQPENRLAENWVQIRRSRPIRG